MDFNCQRRDYTLTAINEQIYKQLLLEDWSKDLVSNYSSFEEFSQYGMGFVITKDKIIISGASAYTYYHGGIDIEVDTYPKYRQHSFAFIVASKLILTCLEKGLYPNWDAHSIESLHLAEKLGYHLDKAYTVSLINLL